MPEFVIADHIQRLKPYHPGKPIEEVQRELGLTSVIKLASNENPLGPSPKAVAAIQEAAKKVAFYPEGAAPTLRCAISERLGVGEDWLVFGNGSDEILHLLCETLLTPGESEIIQGDPSFSMYEIYATLANARVIKVGLKDFTHDLDAIVEAVSPATRLIFVANPNNPSGTVVPQKPIERFLDRLPDHVFVLFDEAYFEYVEHPERADLIPFIREGRNLIITRTFSKAYGLAGLRVGYGIARPEIAGLLNRARSPFNVNMIAQAAALAAWNDTEHLKASLSVNATGKKQIYEGLERMRVPYVPTEANFLLIDISPRTSQDVFDGLLKKGVIVRAGVGLGYPNHIRVTIGTKEQNERFLSALKEVLV
ncbi:MAG TPA: histidinol-phosphate transaminase [Capsulimonadaceae bacterium]|nr:histidinol-phosphate transaminase [Capsulimonadaceae bacterium]